MSQYWFKPKKYGYGGYPVTWQGWVATFCLCFLIFVVIYVDLPIGAERPPDLKELARYFLDFNLIIILFLGIIKDKVEGGLKWRWGNK